MPYNFETLEFEPDIDPVTGQPKPPDPNEYVKQKYGIGQPKPEADQPSDLGGKFSGALAALGAGFQGKDSFAAGNQAMANHRDSIKRSRESDPNSEESMFAKEAAKRMGYKGDVSNLTAEKFKGISPVMEKMYEVEQRRLDRQENRKWREDLQNEKKDEKMQGLKTPYGMANNEDDAKKLKEAFVAKKNFDNKLSQMIALRKKHKGGAILNREDVGVGQQLSKDLLLEYKNMAKLGVLSQADEAIINAIIPADPLEYNSPLAAMQGQDPILSKLETFQKNSDTDFNNNVKTRTRSGVETAALPDKKDRTVVKTQTNQKTGAKKIIYSDGTEEIIPATKVAGGR